MKLKNKYDLIIVGGGTSGTACAYTAGKLGLKVLLIEKKSYLGGAITSSLVIPAMKTSKKAINTDFFDKLYNTLKDMNGAITYSDGNKGWFNPELTKIALDSLILEAKVDIIFNAEIKNIEEYLSGYIVSIEYDNEIIGTRVLLSHIDTRYIVDATGDAKICEKLNYKFIENKNNTQPVSLRFIMAGVNINKFADWLLELDKDTNVTTVYKSKNYTYLSTAYTWDKSRKWALEPLFNDAIRNNILTEEDCNYFQVFSVAGTQDTIAFNCPRLIKFNNNPYIDGRKSILKLSNFCKKYLPGFEQSYISNIANTLGIRFSRCVKGRYEYTKEDLITGKKFKNPVVISDYPIDVHSDKKNKSKLEKVVQEYQLPIESLIVDKNLYVIGRCLSADFEAQAALRIIPSCFSMGEGLAKYLAKIISDSMNIL